jgi:cell division septum initiation protein DivIVA
MIGDRSIYTFEQDNLELKNEVHRLREKIKKIKKIKKRLTLKKVMLY